MVSAGASVMATSEALICCGPWAGNFRTARGRSSPSLLLNKKPCRTSFLQGFERDSRLTHIAVAVAEKNEARGPACPRALLPVDPWSPNVDSQSIASSLFAASLFPYLGFLYFLHRSNTSPRITLFGFYFLLAFVGATIPAGIYAKTQYGTSLSNVDYLHGSAESLLTITNLLIVLGLRDALRKKGSSQAEAPTVDDESIDTKTKVSSDSTTPKL